MGLLGLALGSCAEEPSDLTVLHGPYVDYQHSPDLTPCSGNLDEVNNFVTSVAGAMKISLDGLPSLSFSWVTPEDLAERTSECTDSCALGERALSIRPIINHELAHALYYQVNAHPVELLSEGFATAMDILHYIDYGAIESRDPRDPLDGSDVTPDLYGKSGLFVIYLIQRFGAANFQALYASLDRGASRAGWDEAFQTVYGSPVDAIVEEYLAATDCPDDVTPFPPYGCEAPLLPMENGAWHYHRTLRCADPDVFGGVDNFAGFATTVTLDVKSEGDYDVSLVSPTDAKSLLSIAECNRCRWLPEAIVLGQGQVRRATFAPGRHVMTIRLFEGDGHDFYVSLTPAQ